MTPPGGPVREEPPTKEEPPPKKPEEPEDCWPWWPPGPEPEPPPPGAGGDGDQSGRPSGRPQMPTMHLSPLLRPENTPSQPDVIDAEAGMGVAASDTAVAPITLPIIVAPPVALPGGVAPRGLPTEPVPGSPRSSAAEPAAGRQAATRRGCPQRRRSTRVVPHRLYRLPEERRNLASGCLGRTRTRGHADPHRFGWTPRVPAGKGRPCSTHRPSCKICELN